MIKKIKDHYNQQDKKEELLKTLKTTKQPTNNSMDELKSLIGARLKKALFETMVKRSQSPSKDTKDRSFSPELNRDISPKMAKNHRRNVPMSTALSYDSQISSHGWKVTTSQFKNEAASTNVRSSLQGGFSSKYDTSKSQEPFQLSKRSRNERHHRLKEMYTQSSLRHNYFQKNGRLKQPKAESEMTVVEQKHVGNCQYLNIMEPVTL